MKEIMKSTLGIIGIMILIIVLLEKSKTNSIQEGDIFSEEATPIREHSVITKIDYKITINNNTKEKDITCYTKILSSIKHYKDIESITTFPITLKINNESYYHYHLKDIYIGNNIEYIKNINYKNIKKDNYTFNINNDILLKYKEQYDVIVKLSK